VFNGLKLLAISTALGALSGSAIAQQPCDGGPGACFVSIDGAVTFSLEDTGSGWTVFITYVGDHAFFRSDSKGDLFLHTIDQNVALLALGPGELQLAGTGRLIESINGDADTGLVTCPVLIDASGTVGGRWLEAKLHITRGNPGGESFQLPWADDCYVKELSVNVGP